MDIQNKIIEIINSYSYDDEVLEIVKNYENNAHKEGEIIELYFKIDSKFIAYNKEEIAKKVAEKIIHYRIREKAFIKLMTKGVLHPVGIGTGKEEKSVEYQYGTSQMRTHTYTTVYFPRSVFTSFMKV